MPFKLIKALWPRAFQTLCDEILIFLFSYLFQTNYINTYIQLGFKSFGNAMIKTCSHETKINDYIVTYSKNIMNAKPRRANNTTIIF